MAWNAAKPTDDGLLVNFPGECRANWDALALGTDVALLITNAKVSASAAIEESKILFAGSGHGHTGGVGGKQIVLTTAVSGTLPTGNGGTGATSAANAANGVVILGADGKLNVSYLTGTLPRAQGGLATTVANNAASGPVFLDASSKLPPVDGSQLTNLPGVWTHSGTQAYSGGTSNSFSDLDLSSIVGSKYALVFLKVANNHTDPQTYAFRPNGSGALSSQTYWGTTTLRVNNGETGYICIETDAAGIIEWLSRENWSAGSTTAITVLGYIKAN